ncbi:MAG TPA: aldo/keto reductase [Vicinamibacterales bacterium]|nr:aldo/keto reductase [Vicinamibacterales bacterium]
MAIIPTRPLGISDLHLTPIGLGAWAIGGEWRFGWGPQEDAESIATIRRAVEHGLNWIDTAAVYGLGHSEEVVGRALREIPRNDRPYVFTKCSLVWDESGNTSHNLAPQSIRKECEASLRRLETERIDLYQIHWAAWHASPPDHDPGSIEEAWSTLVALKDEGKVASIGVSNFDVGQLQRIQRIETPASLQPPYSMLRPEIEQELLPFCQQHNIGVIPYSPMQSGLLSGKMTRERIASLPAGDWRRNNRFFQEPLLSKALSLVERLQGIGARHGRTPGEVTIAWTLRHPAITATIVGARKPNQVDELAGALTFRLSKSEEEELACYTNVTSATSGYRQ